ncbi:cold-shock protein [candidate division KSB1 bacterium]|nr:cold-shock protein [bacterium]OQX56969.1 MAG: cold-shock protein [candidate division KSB1 bacterium 4484_219]RKY80491.1 MAG: cold-shock protein [candidate division KSB1 bacterium]RKY80854.1 MAG: cold-shock protein [candidate division KSB1 bacterium]RKY92844.1 MAG: cold-shock protein [candidate division KSB1 bacterium]
MPEGKVKWFDRRKGYGFIQMDSGEDIFVHKSGVKYTGFKDSLQQNQRVSFDVAEDKKGKKAVNVKAI